ncbi:MAG: EscS/YscS/HrcS family type III secretion system export apparatus protein [Spirochaetes bacterium GWD1_27_9]|nr:MAG: EscS/YscS/HrcS family type III secretion system export apparatus protein [Spirochaetes bacterium GWB1_27_13]OHD24458.1 MAG: EscS/YscS/HrcS family type III secretion system export apparatus protein [Spirochaetes bacterium GWC1_27_15]OHD30228.1 MAG: EscS/YscS/HrcS family type III secretion system export apparatus protein [Spirochaetes bacterium GWD1_27_9]
MDTELIKEVMIESMRITILISLPILGAGLVVGLIISILQATTSIQEQTLTFVPKLIAIVLALVIFGPWMTSTLMEFTIQIFDLIPDMALAVP